MHVLSTLQLWISTAEGSGAETIQPRYSMKSGRASAEGCILISTGYLLVRNRGLPWHLRSDKGILVA